MLAVWCYCLPVNGVAKTIALHTAVTLAYNSSEDSHMHTNDCTLGIARYAYSTAKSLVGREFGPLNSPLRLNPGEFVELKTWRYMVSISPRYHEDNSKTSSFPGLKVSKQ